MKSVSRIFILYIVTLFVFMFFISCGGDKTKSAADSPEMFLPETSASTGLARVSEISTYEGQALWEYINGGAEVYHLYDFESVATADYKNNEIEIIVDIYKFNGSKNAFGLYSTAMRSDMATIIKMGVEGYIDPASVTFVKGEYVVKLTGYDESTAGAVALSNFAEELSGKIPGDIDYPANFGLFPEEDLIESSKKLYSESYLGQKFLTDMYTQSYEIGGDTLNLFIANDITGEKYAQWLNMAQKMNSSRSIANNPGYDSTYSFEFDDHFYGEIIIGLKNGKLAGAVSYKADFDEFMAKWIGTL